jgi:hypothetical protein
MNFKKSEYFKEKSKKHYKIEAKNSELKHRHGYMLHHLQVLLAYKCKEQYLKRIIKINGSKIGFKFT